MSKGSSPDIPAGEDMEGLSHYDLKSLIQDYEDSWFAMPGAKARYEAAKRRLDRFAKDEKGEAAEFERNKKQEWRERDEAKAAEEAKERANEAHTREKRKRESAQAESRHRRDQKDTERGMYNRRKKKHSKKQSSPKSERSWTSSGPRGPGEQKNPGEIVTNANKNVFEKLMLTYKVKGDLTTKKGVKSAYRKLAVKLHPDKTRGDSAKEADFKELGRSYDALKELGLASRKKQTRRKKEKKKKKKKQTRRKKSKSKE
jgi:hypothetical protein